MKRFEVPALGRASAVVDAAFSNELGRTIWVSLVKGSPEAADGSFSLGECKSLVTCQQLFLKSLQ